MKLTDCSIESNWKHWAFYLYCGSVYSLVYFVNVYCQSFQLEIIRKKNKNKIICCQLIHGFHSAIKQWKKKTPTLISLSPRKKSARKLNCYTNDEIIMKFISINIKWNARKLYLFRSVSFVVPAIICTKCCKLYFSRKFVMFVECKLNASFMCYGQKSSVRSQNTCTPKPQQWSMQTKRSRCNTMRSSRSGCFPSTAARKIEMEWEKTCFRLKWENGFSVRFLHLMQHLMQFLVKCFCLWCSGFWLLQQISRHSKPAKSMNMQKNVTLFQFKWQLFSLKLFFSSRWGGSLNERYCFWLNFCLAKL